MALITVVTEDHLLFLTNVGLNMCQGVRNISICQYVILPDSAEVFVIPDTTQDDRFKDLPIVKDAGIKFYAATTVRLNDVKIGTFCLLDTQTRDDFTKEKIERLGELGNVISSVVFEKTNLEAEHEERLAMDVIHSVCKDLLLTLQKMLQAQNELLRLNPIVNPSSTLKKSPLRGNTPDPVTTAEESITLFENSKKDLMTSRHALQTALQNGLKSIDNLKKNCRLKRSSSKTIPYSSSFTSVSKGPKNYSLHSKYCSLSSWYQKLQQFISQNIPNYHKYMNNIRWEFMKLNQFQDYEMNEGSLAFLSCLLTLLMMINLQKWKYVKVSFMIYEEENDIQETGASRLPTPKVGQGLFLSPNNNSKKSGFFRESGKSNTGITTANQPNDPTNNGGGNGKKVEFNREKDQENHFYYVTGRLSIEIKGSTSLRSSLFPGTKKVPEDFPLFNEESQFFSIYDNFIANAFQILTGEYQKYSNKNEEFTNFWISCFLKEIFDPNTTSNPDHKQASKMSNHKLLNQQSKGKSFWNLSINNILTNDWFYRNKSKKNPSGGSSSQSNSQLSISGSNNDLIPSYKYHTANRIEEGGREEEFSHNPSRSMNASTINSKDTNSNHYSKSINSDRTSETNNLSTETNDLQHAQHPVNPTVIPTSIHSENTVSGYQFLDLREANESTFHAPGGHQSSQKSTAPVQVTSSKKKSPPVNYNNNKSSTWTNFFGGFLHPRAQAKVYTTNE